MLGDKRDRLGLTKVEGGAVKFFYRYKDNRDGVNRGWGRAVNVPRVRTSAFAEEQTSIIAQDREDRGYRNTVATPTTISRRAANSDPYSYFKFSVKRT